MPNRRNSFAAPLGSTNAVRDLSAGKTPSAQQRDTRPQDQVPSQPMLPSPEQPCPYLLAVAARRTRPSVPDDKWEPSPYSSRFPVPPPNFPPPEIHRESPTLPTPTLHPDAQNPSPAQFYLT